MDSPSSGSSQVIEAKHEKIRRLIADQQYFGLDAKAFHDGAERALARIAAAAPQPPRITVRSLGQDFRLDADDSWTLLRSLVTGGLLILDGPASYRPSARFQEYACAELVMPMSRARAKTLLENARGLAARINAHWARNRYRIEMILVSGSYMSRRERLPELSLWLLLHRRHEARTRRLSAGHSKQDSLRQITAAVKELSSFLVVHVVADKQGVPRPFGVVFEAQDEFPDSVHSWHRFRDWGASISRRLSLK